MNEWTLQLYSGLRIIFLAFYVYLYGSGGIWNKSTRRIFGSLLLTLGYVLFSLLENTFSFYYIICFPLLIISTSLGYGSSNLIKKIWKRFYCGLAYACAALPIFIVTQNWVMFVLHILICLLTSIILGVINPVSSRKEETLIGISIGLIPLFTV